MGLVAMTTLKANWVGIYHCPEGVGGREGRVLDLHMGLDARTICCLLIGSHQSLCIYLLSPYLSHSLSFLFPSSQNLNSLLVIVRLCFLWHFVQC